MLMYKKDSNAACSRRKPGVCGRGARAPRGRGVGRGGEGGAASAPSPPRALLLLLPRPSPHQEHLFSRAVSCSKPKVPFSRQGCVSRVCKTPPLARLCEFVYVFFSCCLSLVGKPGRPPAPSSFSACFPPFFFSCLPPSLSFIRHKTKNTQPISQVPVPTTDTHTQASDNRARAQHTATVSRGSDVPVSLLPCLSAIIPFFLSWVPGRLLQPHARALSGPANARQSRGTHEVTQSGDRLGGAPRARARAGGRPTKPKLLLFWGA